MHGSSIFNEGVGEGVRPRDDLVCWGGGGGGGVRGGIKSQFWLNISQREFPGVRTKGRGRGVRRPSV